MSTPPPGSLLFLQCDHTQPSVISRPYTITVEPCACSVIDKPDEFPLPFRRHQPEKTPPKRLDPIVHALSALKRRRPLEQRGKSDTQAVGFEQVRILRQAGKIPRIRIPADAKRP